MALRTPRTLISLCPKCASCMARPTRARMQAHRATRHKHIVLNNMHTCDLYKLCTNARVLTTPPAFSARWKNRTRKSTTSLISRQQHIVLVTRIENSAPTASTPCFCWQHPHHRRSHYLQSWDRQATLCCGGQPPSALPSYGQRPASHSVLWRPISIGVLSSLSVS